ncbi:MAG: NusG domain II-containing protein [Clostridia bacterium]|nr:NusG domain II-containing protein [Clostridia bacterium]
MKKLIKTYKHDILIFCIAVFIGLSGLLYMNIMLKPGDRVQIMVEGKLAGEYSLSEDFETDIAGLHQGRNHLVIKDGTASVTRATCPDLICCKHAPISKNGESIVCLPNQIVIKVISSQEGAYDGISQ